MLTTGVRTVSRLPLRLPLRTSSEAIGASTMEMGVTGPEGGVPGTPPTPNIVLKSRCWAPVGASPDPPAGAAAAGAAAAGAGMGAAGAATAGAGVTGVGGAGAGAAGEAVGGADADGVASP